MRPAGSSGVSDLPLTVMALRISFQSMASGKSMVFTMGVSTWPGEMALTRMFCFTYSQAMARVMMATPPLEAP